MNTTKKIHMSHFEMENFDIECVAYVGEKSRPLDGIDNVIYRTFLCLDCEMEFEVVAENSNDPDPPCPRCSQVLQWVPARLNITTNKARAIDYTQKIIEQDFGLSDLNDRNREGDVAYKPPAPMHTSEREQIEREVREYVSQVTEHTPTPVNIAPPQAQAGQVNMSFWGGGPPPGQVAAQPISTQAALAGLKVGPEADVNPMQYLQDGIKSGQLATKARIIGRWRP